jgi:Transglutaminase-like superfamily
MPKRSSALLRQRLRKFFRQSRRDRLLLIEATVWLGLARLTIGVLPFRWLAPYLGQQQRESPTTDVPDAREHVRCISRAVLTMSRHAPWQSSCLAQAIAAKMMLQHRGICSTLYLGVAKDGDEGLVAHAWLRSGATVLTGEPGWERFTVVSTFAEKQE